MSAFDSIFFVSSFMWFIVYLCFTVYAFKHNRDVFVNILNITRAIAIALLLIAACKFRLSYSYYTILRFIVCGVSIYCIWFSLKTNHNVWVGIFIIIAILFNPIIQIHLQKATWNYIDIVTALVFLLSSLFLLRSNIVNSVDIEKTKVSDDNIEIYSCEVGALYNQAYYEKALVGLQKLSSFKAGWEYNTAPLIEKCISVSNKTASDEDKAHASNKKIFERFGWVSNMIYIVGGQAVILFFSGIENIDEDSGEIISSTNWWVLGLSILLGVITFLLYTYTKEINVSKNMVRCKYCGHYTRYINPDEPTMGFMKTNNCAVCERMYPVADSYWDSWDGLEYINKRHSVPDTQFYEEYNQLKTKYEKEYEEWLREKKEIPKEVLPAES